MANQEFSKGLQVFSEDEGFISALQAAVDYRGDTTLELKDGSKAEGYLFSFDGTDLDLFPTNSPRKETVKADDVNAIVFSGDDTSQGKSWEDWQAKKAKSPEGSSTQA